MRGKRRIDVSIGRVEYNIVLERKVTVLKGNSATGKTAFIDAIRMWNEMDRKSGVRVSSDAKLIMLSGGVDWKIVLQSNKDCIVLADEGLDFILSKEFADYVNRSDNYFFLCLGVVCLRLWRILQ